MDAAATSTTAAVTHMVDASDMIDATHMVDASDRRLRSVRADASDCDVLRGEISGSDAADRKWDVIVIGAGPAGLLAARLLAQRQRSVLLIEAKSFPRYKVCGGCLNAHALAILAEAGLGHLPHDAGGVPIDALEVCCGGRSARFALPGGLSLSRSLFDQRLLEAALEVGVRLVSQSTATVEQSRDGPWRIVTAQQRQSTARLAARVVVCADGLLRSAVRQFPELASRVAPQSRLGIGAFLTSAEISEAARARIATGMITMVVGSMGYVGLARAESNGLSVAAAISPEGLKATGSPAAAVARILTEAGLPFPDPSGLGEWHGTPLLTSRARRVAAAQLFVLGDAAGYVEPFTGEGMAAALDGAWLAAPLIDRAVDGWDDSLSRAWETTYHRAIRRRQWICRGLTTLARRPLLVRGALPLIARFPAAARLLISRVHRPRVADTSLMEGSK